MVMQNLMNLKKNSFSNDPFFEWPITIYQNIDERLPDYETLSIHPIPAILEGVVESVGSTTQARTSYLPSEILWGKRWAEHSLSICTGVVETLSIFLSCVLVVLNTWARKCDLFCQRKMRIFQIREAGALQEGERPVQHRLLQG